MKSRNFHCRYCNQGHSVNNSELIAPCLCSDRVHRSCLDAWRLKSPDGINGTSFYQCHICSYAYQFKHADANTHTKLMQALITDVLQHMLVAYPLLAFLTLFFIITHATFNYWIFSSFPLIAQLICICMVYYITIKLFCYCIKWMWSYWITPGLLTRLHWSRPEFSVVLLLSTIVKSLSRRHPQLQQQLADVWSTYTTDHRKHCPVQNRVSTYATQSWYGRAKT